MEKAFYCKECNAVNLLENNNKEFLGACHQCGAVIRELAEGITKNTILANRYQILDLVEEGHVSDLYFATDLSTEELVLARIYCFDYSFCISNPEEFLHMSESVSKLAQSTHVEIIDYGLDDDLIFTVWPGDSIESIDRLLEQHDCFDPEVAVGICLKVAKCLAKVYDETGISHFDINTKNIFVNSQGYVKLAGLGFTTQLYQDASFLESNVEYYDWQYQSPEITLNLHEADIRSDMYSLGFCLYTMVSGKKPFDSVRPLSSTDYERLNFTRSEQFRLGDNFINLFRDLTATRISERYNSWHDVIKSMDRYLNEGAVKKSAFSGKVRSMTTSYDLDHFKENENQTPPVKVKTRKKRKSMSVGDIKKNQGFSKPPLKKSTPRKTKAVLPGQSRKQKKRDNTVPIIISVAAALGVLLMVILAQSSKNNQNNTASKTKETSKENNEKTKPTKKTTPKNDTPDSPPKIKKTDPNSQEAFNEIKFEVRELALKRQWEEALANCDQYTGPFKTDMEKLRQSVLKQRNTFLGNQITNNSPKSDPKPAPKVAVVDEKPEPKVQETTGDDLQSLAELIYKGQVLRAISRIPAVEKKEKLDLNLLERMLESATEDAIDDLIAENYQKEVGKIISLTVDSVRYKGTLLQVIETNNELKIRVTFQGRQFERIYPFNEISFNDNIQRIVKTDKDENALLQFIYLVPVRYYLKLLCKTAYGIKAS